MFQKISAQNKFLLDKPLSTDIVYASELNEWNTNNAFRSFCIKYVIDGCISYSDSRFYFDVRSGHYLMACKKDYVKGELVSPHAARSFCIDICPETIAETYTILTTANEDFDSYLAGYFHCPEFMETLHQVQSTSIGNKLLTLLYKVNSGADILLNKEWFIDLAERMIYQEYGNYMALKEIHSVKPSTRKEVLRRLQVAKEFIDHNYLQIRLVSEVADHCSMSEYHFYRRFKEVYKRTPYQYLTEIKMQAAKSLLLEKKYTITDVASLSGFQDVFTFSKAFKKFYGIPPSQVR
ncbi:MAG: helix-turn-helix transcriptional regulator [Flavisolibacter sp.]|nr:helix-turn-helix transcriptional regulator [Flavisolibacter sp.]